MSAVPSFPLLNLPFVPLKEIISYMDLIDQVCFSMLSKKTDNLAKTKQIFHLEIYSGNMKKVVYKNQDESTFLTVEIQQLYQNHERKYGLTRTIGGLAVPMKLVNHTLKTFWNNKIEGLQKMSSLLCKILRVGSLSVYLFRDTVETCSQVIENTRKLELESSIKINKISMNVMSQVEDCIRYLMEKCSDIPEVTVDSFNSVHKLALSATESYCEIKNFHWATFNDLNLLTKYKNINVWKLKFTNQELKSFLKKWMERLTMENFYLTVENVDLKVALEGLSVTSQTKNLTFHNMELGPMYCLEIQRKDGVKANFWSYDGYVVMQTYK